LQIQIESSYKNIIGTAIRHWVNASGVGVMTAATINIATIANFLLLLKKAGVTMPTLESIITATGNSKTIPKDINIMITKERYFDIDNIGYMFGPAKLIRNFTAQGITKKKAKATPDKKRIIENGNAKNITRLSLSVRPVDTKAQS